MSNHERREQVTKWAEENAHKVAVVGSLTWAANNLFDALEALGALEETNARIEKELNAGDSWAWIRAKFEKSKDKFRWFTPRTDELIGTRYEVMGWLHCLFADADPTVFIDITLEHQKRTDEAEAKLRALRVDLQCAEQHLENGEQMYIAMRDRCARTEQQLQDAEEKIRGLEALIAATSQEPPAVIVTTT